jgi:hypothetical protein
MTVAATGLGAGLAANTPPAFAVDGPGKVSSTANTADEALPTRIDVSDGRHPNEIRITAGEDLTLRATVQAVAGTDSEGYVGFDVSGMESAWRLPYRLTHGIPVRNGVATVTMPPYFNEMVKQHWPRMYPLTIVAEYDGDGRFGASDTDGRLIIMR